MIPTLTKPIVDGATMNCWCEPETTVEAVAEAHLAGKGWHVVASAGGQQRRELRPNEQAALIAAVTNTISGASR